MPLDGAPDFQAQAVQTVTAVQDVSVSTIGSQSTDITNNLQPYHQCLLIYWKASAISVGEAVVVEVDAPLSGMTLGQARLIEDGQGALFVMPGQLTIGQFAGGCNVVASVPSGGASPLTGDLLVLALSAIPLVIPQSNLQVVQPSLTTGAIVVAAGTTLTVLAAPQKGTYNRIKCLSWRMNVAPAAATALNWQDASGTAIVQTEVQPAVGQQSQVALDWITTGSIALNNGSTVGAQACIAYEQYFI